MDLGVFVDAIVGVDRGCRYWAIKKKKIEVEVGLPWLITCLKDEEDSFCGTDRNADRLI